jgi:hypothetical protein
MQYNTINRFFEKWKNKKHKKKKKKKKKKKEKKKKKKKKKKSMKLYNISILFSILVCEMKATGLIKTMGGVLWS